MIKRFKNIRLATLTYHVIVTLAYPLIKAVTSPKNRLLVFTDTMTIVALILIIVGVVFSMILHGDFDISSYYLQHGVKSFRNIFTKNLEMEMPKKDASEYMSEAREKRAGAFNYPLFLGIAYLLISAVIAYGFLS